MFPRRSRLATLWLGLPLLLGLAGAQCFNPDTSQVRNTCTKEAPECLPGARCVEGWCLFPGDSLPDLSLPPDAGVADQAPPPPPDLTAVRPSCSGAGVALSVDVSACEGPYNPGEAAGRCGAGFEICSDVPSAVRAQCDTTPGFYTTRQTLHTQSFNACTGIDPMFVSCSQTKTYQTRMGCGDSKLAAVSPCQHSCSGFNRGLNCSQGSTSGVYTCGIVDPPQSDTSKRSEIGVLCCRKK